LENRSRLTGPQDADVKASRNVPNGRQLRAPELRPCPRAWFGDAVRDRPRWSREGDLCV